VAKTSARSLAFDVLLQVALDDAYTNLVLPKALASSGFSERDRALATELVYGTSRRAGELDVVVASASGRAVTSLDTGVLVLLRMAVYQLLFLRIPDHAAVAESVELAKSRGFARASGLVNAVLRNVTRGGVDKWTAVIANSAEVVASHPVWIARLIEESLAHTRDHADLLEALEGHNQAPRVTLAHLPGLSSPEKGHTLYSPLGEVLSSGNPADVPGVSSGDIRVQDEGSQLAALLLAHVDPLTEDDVVLDLCAGPGGKTAVLAAEALRVSARVVAWERAPHRARLVEDSVRAITSSTPETVTIVVGDALTLSPPEGPVTRVLVDAPCSGMGALRRRPESRWRKAPEEIPELVSLQQGLLHRALDLVAPGGVVAYVTCSPVLGETHNIVSSVLRSRSDAETINTAEVLNRIVEHPIDRAASGPAVQLWTYRHGCDDMFIQLLRKRRSVV
jgi:16S rRNA (cytosine967-C5)-methyltransferase